MKETTEAAVERYAIEVETPEAYRCIGETDFVTSRELCERIINPIGRAVFADYYGCTFDVDTNGQFFVTMYFDHLKHNDITAFTDEIEVTEAKNELVGRIRKQRRMFTEGNTFKPTTQCKEALSEFIDDRFKDRNGNVNWVNQTTDVAQPNRGEVLSRVSGISVEKLLAKIYGSNEGDVRYTYDVKILTSIANNAFAMQAVNKDYLVSVTRINEVELDRALRNAGIVNPNGLGIIKSR